VRFFTVKIALLIFFLVNLSVKAEGDYEVQFDHFYSNFLRSKQGLKELPAEMSLVFMSRGTECAESLRTFYGESRFSSRSGQWLGYTSKIKISFQPKKIKGGDESWLRLQFFIGIAFNCDLDSVSVK